MPPKARATRKRTLSETDSNISPRGPKARKSSGATAAGATAPVEDASAGPATTQDHASQPRYHISRGPNGEALMPRVMPRECVDDIQKIPMPGFWVSAIDAIPGREMTLGNRRWWEEYGPWLEAHKKKLSLKAADWKRKDEALAQEPEVEEGEPKDPWDFICIHSQASADGDEEDEDEDEDEEPEEEDDDAESADNAPDKEKPKKANPIGKLASLHPEHKWISSILGQDRSRWWLQESFKRDPDSFGMYIYNDFGWYGKIEVFENIFLRFSDLVKRKAPYQEIWPEAEGLALIFDTSLTEFVMADDGERVGKLIEVIGYMFIACLESLKKQNVLKADSPIPNLGLVIAIVIEWAQGLIDGFDGFDGNVDWVYRVIELAEEAHIELTGPTSITEIVMKLKSGQKPSASSMKKYKDVKWATKLKTYSSRYGTGVFRGGIGGSQFDITKMSAAERKRYSLGP